jgi:hypothetical protein
MSAELAASKTLGHCLGFFVRQAHSQAADGSVGTSGIGTKRIPVISGWVCDGGIFFVLSVARV